MIRILFLGDIVGEPGRSAVMRAVPVFLKERGVDFVAADMPDANRLTIHIIAAVAESVGRTISENTRTALAAAKARGVKLGNPNGARALGPQRHRRRPAGLRPDKRPQYR